MELDIIEHTKTRLKFKINGESHSFCNALRKELWADKQVDIGGYQVQHSLISAPVFTVETAKGDPKKILLQTAERLNNINKELLAKFSKL